MAADIFPLYRLRSGIPLILLCAILTLPVYGDTTKTKDVIELTYTSPAAIFIFRPADFTLPGETFRIDFLAGRRFSAWTAYIYWKGDNHHGRWMGGRLDTAVPFANPRMRANLQLRYFQGLNPSSTNHYYVIPSLYYSVGGSHPVQLGCLGFGKKDLNGDATFYVGPAVVIPIASGIRARVSYGENLLGKGALLYLKLSIGFH